jgi:hypothetical protein
VTRAAATSRAVPVVMALAATIAAAPPAVRAQTPPITVHNSSPLAICFVSIFRPEGDTGPERLPGEETIEPGASRAFEVGPGSWNVMAGDCDDGATLGFAFHLPPGAETTVGGSGRVAVRIQNERGERVCEVRESDGDNVLPYWRDSENPSYVESLPMDAGEAQWVFLSPGVHALEARSCDGETVQSGEIDVPRQTVWKVALEPPPACTVPTEAPRITGLERLYFRRIEGRLAGDPSIAQAIGARAVKALLPEKLRPGQRHWEPAAAENTDRVLGVQDFQISAPGGAHEWLLREVRDTSNRLTEEWWAFYDDGCRTDVWYFTPDPALTEGKLVTEIALQAVTRPEADGLNLAVAGQMDRPAGAWWQMSADLLFRVSADGFALQRVANRTRVFHDYDRLQKPVTMSAVVERDVTLEGTPMVEVRSRDGISPRRAKACLEAAEGIGGSAMAQCLVAGPGADVRHRPRQEPSPIERGGR